MNESCPFCHLKQSDLWEVFGPEARDEDESETFCGGCGRVLKIVIHIDYAYEVKLE